MSRDEGFLSRWSRRKLEGGAPDAGNADAAPRRAEPGVPPPVAGATDAVPEPARDPAPPPPTLEDAQALTPESDFRPFVARETSPQVRNLAMRRLFADPHFNVMDGLDVYIDDYSVSTPVPAEVLARMASAAFLNLVEKPPEETPGPAADPAVAQSGDCSSPLAACVPPASQATDDHHADLRLQQDDAPGAEPPRHHGG